VTTETAAAARATVRADQLRTFAAGVLEAAGMPRPDAETMAQVLVWSDLRGITKQGVLRLPLCVQRMRAGGTRPAASLVTVRDTPGLVVLDAQDSWAPVAGARAMRTVIDKARVTGVAAALVRNTTFAFALGYYPTIAIEARMIGLAINDCLPVMAPWGGSEKTLGNQAFAVGAPAGRHLPLLLDTANSAITWTAIHDYQERGQQLPDGVAVDPEGRPTRDPWLALAGRVLPLGGPKGSGLAMLWGVLTGVLAGSVAFGPHVVGPDQVSVPQSTSLFMLAIDPTAAMPYEQFIDRIDAFIDETLASTPEPGLDRTYAPGERGYLTAAQRERDGIPIPAATARALHALGDELGVRWPATS
jgi:LDH2 family malate/lactate/ureidoglycolate dehydrogenase